MRHRLPNPGTLVYKSHLKAFVFFVHSFLLIVPTCLVSLYTPTHQLSNSTHPCPCPPVEQLLIEDVADVPEVGLDECVGAGGVLLRFNHHLNTGL